MLQTEGGVGKHVSVVAATFDERAPTYDDSVLHRDLATAVADFATPSTVRAALDVATGTGLVLRALADRARAARLIGIDVSAGMLQIARRELAHAAFIQAAAESLPIQDGSVDLVTCVTAMHLMARPAVVFGEFARVLAPQGRLILATFQLPPGGSAVARPYWTNHLAYETADLVANAAAAGGFRVRRSTTGRYGDDTCLLTELSR